MADAADRLRREGPSVHHILCDVRRPPVGTPKCTCRVGDVAVAVADLLDYLHRYPAIWRDRPELAAIRGRLVTAITGESHADPAR